MTKANKKYRSGFSIGKTAVSLISLALLFICWRLGLKWMTLPIIAFLLIYYFAIPRIVASRTAHFHREALKLLSTGRAAEIPNLVRRSLILQLLGPRGPLDAKLAMAYSAIGDFQKALPCFERAVPFASSEEKTALRIGLAKALLVTGELARAEAEGRTVLDRGVKLPELLAVVARARVGLGKNDDKTRSLLDEAEKLSPSAEVQLMIELTRIESALAAGRSPGQIPEDADSSQKFLRAWIQLVRGKLRSYRGDEEAARSSYSSVLQTGGCGFAVAEARRIMEEPESDEEKEPKTGGIDPVVRRKKRKRR